jgi:hypothetical protein
MLMIENLLERMHTRLRVPLPNDEKPLIIEHCESWWDILRQDSKIFEVYVSD